MVETTRQHPRAICHFAATADGPRGPLRGACTNLSSGGLFFEGAQLPVGATTRVTLEHPELGQFRASGQVKHHAARGMGIEFTRLEPDMLERLRAILNRLGFSGGHAEVPRATQPKAT